MKPNYKERAIAYLKWIDKNYPNKKSSLNRCNVAVSEITQRFSKLIVQVGYANGRYHCWCKDELGIIIDPTASQFDGEIKYTLIAERFLKKHEIEPATGAIFLDEI